MSRALNLDAPKEHVLATCVKQKIDITQIEALVSGGTRIVLKTGDAAATIGRIYSKKVITGPVSRIPARTMNA